MALPNEITYTSEDYWNLPDGERAELIDGQLFAMAPPIRIHQRLITKFTRIIDQYIDEHRGSCEVYPAPFAVNLNKDDYTWVEPDISVICDKNKLSEKGCDGAPDWIIEITSPRTQSRDYGIKLYKYRNAGVREYWIVNPASRNVMVYDFDREQTTNQYSFDDDIDVGIFPGFVINISNLLK